MRAIYFILFDWRKRDSYLQLTLHAILNIAANAANRRIMAAEPELPKYGAFPALLFGYAKSIWYADGRGARDANSDLQLFASKMRSTDFECQSESVRCGTEGTGLLPSRELWTQ